MITPSFSPTATERVLPRLALDFTTASLDARVTFTRTTDATHPATYVASTGYVTAATNDQPRFDYDPVALTCKGLLIEESRTNSLLQSEDFGTTWFANATVTTNTTVSPSNVQNADTLNTTVADQVVQQVVTVANNSLSNTFSVFVKQGTAAKTGLYLVYYGGTNVSYSATFDWTTKTITDNFGTATAVGVQQYANGFYRIYISAPNNNTGNTNLVCRIYSAGVSFAGGTTGTTIAWGAQCEPGAFPTSYIPTTSAALTRNADVATMTGTNFSSWFNASEGAFYIEGSASAVNEALAVIDDGTLNNRYQLSLASSYTPNFAAISGGSVSCDLYTSAGTVGTNSKLVGAYKVDSYAISSNGGNTSTDTSGAIPVSVNTLRFGVYSNGNGKLNGYLRKFMYYPQRLTNAEVRAFSK